VDTAPLVTPERFKGRTALCVLFFLHAAAMAAYTVPFPNVLRQHGLGHLAPWAMGMGGIAAFISPMFVGYLADRRIAPERLLSALTCLSGILLILVHCAIGYGWGATPFLILMGLYAISNAPGFSLVTSIVMSRLTNVELGFGPIRVWATWGWMLASWAVSHGLRLDVSPAAGFIGGGIFLSEAVFCLFLKPTPRPPVTSPARWRDRFGWEALAMLKHPDHRVILLCSIAFTALISPLYIYTAPHLLDRGDPTPGATMALGQFCEGISMLGLGYLVTRMRLKWLLTTGLALGCVRYVLMACDVHSAIVASLCLHGLVFVLWFATLQIYLEKRVDPSIRSQGQALLPLLNGGVGNLLGYSSIAVWHDACLGADGVMDWVRFWRALAVILGALTMAFVVFYRGQARSNAQSSCPPASAP
jgi:MFS family permease